MGPLTSRPTHVSAITRKRCYLGPRGSQLLILPSIDAARCAGLSNLDLRQAHQNRTEPPPDPSREILARRVLEPGDLVEIAMVELIVHQAKGSFQLGEVHDPAGPLAHRAIDRHPHLKRVAVQPRALVLGGHVRQPMRGFEGEVLVQSQHRIPSALCV